METINEEIEEVKNEEGNEVVSNEVIEEGTKNEDKEVVTTKNEEATAQPKPKVQPKKQPRSVKVVELVACPDCDKKMLPKSLRHSHPRNCKGQPTETRPVNKQQNSYGSKVKEQLRKEIEEEMKVKYNTGGVLGGSATYEKKEQAKEASVPSVPSVPVKMKEHEQPRQLTARELIEASYNEIRKAKREAHMEKINSLNQKCFNC